MPRLLSIETEAELANAVGEAVKALQAGRVVGLRGSTTYSAATLASSSASLQAATQGDRQLWLAVHDESQAQDIAPDLPIRLRRLLDRCWPGPLIARVPTKDGAFQSLVQEAQDALTDGDLVPVVAPDDPTIMSVMSKVAEPLVLTSDVGAAGQLSTAAEFTDAFPAAELVLDTGSVPYQAPASVVEVSGSDFTIVSAGILSEHAINLSACRIYLFVCTGNTCRSPLAEGLFRNLLAERLQCPPEKLFELGYLVQSAGLAAASGSPASRESVEILLNRNIDISSHVSQPLSEQLLEASDSIFTMTNGHRDAILRFRADLGPKVHVLRRTGEDVVDPIGGGMAEYKRCEREIEESLRAIIGSDFDEGC
jgi:protein-tyrosine phosphatase